METKYLKNDELIRLKKIGYTLIIITGIFFLILLLKKPLSILFFIFLLLFIGSIFQTIKYPLSMSKTEKVLIKIGGILGWINTRIILIILFYTMITPISFLLKIFGKNTIETGFDKNNKTYWIDYVKKETKDTLKRQF